VTGKISGEEKRADQQKAYRLFGYEAGSTSRGKEGALRGQPLLCPKKRKTLSGKGETERETEGLQKKITGESSSERERKAPSERKKGGVRNGRRKKGGFYPKIRKKRTSQPRGEEQICDDA